MNINQLIDRLSKFNIGDYVKIKWPLDDVCWRDIACYPPSGIITKITHRGLFLRSNRINSFVGIYDLASGTSIEKVAVI